MDRDRPNSIILMHVMVMIPIMVPMNMVNIMAIRVMVPPPIIGHIRERKLQFLPEQLIAPLEIRIRF